MYKKHVDGRELDLSMSNLSEVNVKEIRALSKVDTIDLSCNNLEQLPEDFGDLMDQVIRLDLSKNRLTHLPASFGRLRSLQHLDLRGNRLRLLPPSFSNLDRLRWLDLKDNDSLEPGLARAAGDCLDERGCRRCATNVVAHMRQVAAGLERERQARLAEERAEAAKQQSREAAERAERREAKKQRRKEQQQQQQQKQRKQDDPSGGRLREDESDSGDDAGRPGAPVVRGAGSRCCAGLLRLVLAVLALTLLALVLVGLPMACVELAAHPTGNGPAGSVRDRLQPVCRWLLPRLPESAIEAAAGLLAQLRPFPPS